MFWVEHRYARVWKIFKAKEKYCDLSVSTSEKKQDGEYERSDWPGRAVGKAFNQIKKGDIKEGESYAIRGKLNNVRYKTEDGTWHDSYRLLINEFCPAGQDIDGGAASSETKPASKPAAEPAAEPAAPVNDAAAAGDNNDLPW